MKFFFTVTLKKGIWRLLTKYAPQRAKRIYHARKAKGETSYELPFYLQPDFLQPIFGGQEYMVSKYIDINKCKDSDILLRCYSLELLLRKSKLS